jgi:hypothetical protein
MQQNPADSNELETLVEIIQKDVEALRAGDYTAQTRLVDRSAQLQRAVETPAEKTFKMRFAARLSGLHFHSQLLYRVKQKIN